MRTPDMPNVRCGLPPLVLPRKCDDTRLHELALLLKKSLTVTQIHGTLLKGAEKSSRAALCQGTPVARAAASPPFSSLAQDQKTFRGPEISRKFPVPRKNSAAQKASPAAVAESGRQTIEYTFLWNFVVHLSRAKHLPKVFHDHQSCSRTVR